MRKDGLETGCEEATAKNRAKRKRRLQALWAGKRPAIKIALLNEKRRRAKERRALAKDGGKGAVDEKD